MILDTYGWDGQVGQLVETVRERVAASAEGIRRIAAAGDPTYQKMLEEGVDAALDTAVQELAGFPAATHG